MEETPVHWLLIVRAINVRSAPDSRHTLLGCGCSSGVEHNLAKVGGEGWNPIARSRFLNDLRTAR